MVTGGGGTACSEDFLFDAPQTLLIGNKVPTSDAIEAPTYFARIEDNPTVFTIAAEPFDKLREAEEALRERSFMSIDPTALTSIELSEGDLQIRLNHHSLGYFYGA